MTTRRHTAASHRSRPVRGDLTIIARDLYSTQGLRVTTGSAVASGTTPVLRTVVPMADGASTCAASTPPRDSKESKAIKGGSGSIALGSDVSLLMHSAGTMDISNGMSFSGQMYSCQMSELKNDVTVRFRSLAPTTTPATTTPSEPSSGTTGAPTWSLTDVRDLPSR